MYKMVIADDEAMIRKGISRSIDWHELGFELVASFEDGADVIEYIKNNPVDVILSDIVMCNIGGLEIAKYISDNNLSIETVLMSGYQDFKYAHNAIKYHVYDYLLKPVTNDEFYEKFRLLKEKLDKQGERKIAVSGKNQNDFIDCITDIQTVMMKKIWNGQLADHDIFKLICSYFNFDIIDEDNVIMSMCQYSEDGVSIRTLLGSRQRKLADKGFLVSQIDENHILILFNNQKDSDSNKKIRLAISLLSEQENTFFFVKKKTVSLNFSKNLEDLPKIETLVDIISKSVSYLQNLDKLQLNISEWINIECSIDNSLLTVLIKLSIEIFCLRLLIVGISDDMLQMLFKNFEFNYDNIQDSLKRLYDKMIAIQNGPFNSEYDFAIEKVTKYIKSHLNEDISVNALADMVHLNSAYFGRYFKKAMFVTVKQYIYEKRMELAIKLLAKKKYTVVEIAKMVGYDFKYFFPLFKKYTGYTPKEYLKFFID